MSETIRLDRVETDVGSLSERLGRTETELRAIDVSVSEMRESVNKNNNLLQQLLNRTGGIEAAKGMIPVTYVTWGVGLMVSLMGVGLTTLTIAATVILFAVNNNATVQDTAVTNLERLATKDIALIASESKLRDEDFAKLMEERKTFNQTEREWLKGEILGLRGDVEFRDGVYDQRLAHLEAAIQESRFIRGIGGKGGE